MPSLNVANSLTSNSGYDKHLLIIKDVDFNTTSVVSESNANVSITAKKLNVEATSNAGYGWITLSGVTGVVPNVNYYVSIDVNTPGGSSAILGIGTSQGTHDELRINIDAGNVGLTTYTGNFLASASSLYVKFQVSVSGETVVFDNFIVRETTS
tara:strand:- start:8 stop:469 length:462 start_codon:yes stop_codon:yes gene_type:complete